MIKTLFVDDEQTAIDLLQWLTHQYCPDITAVQSATTVEEAARKIRSFRPDLVFLDIKMPGQNGFDLLLEVTDCDFEIIFTTAFNEYAIQAIKFSALDYLLKPIDAEELVKAVERFKIKRATANGGIHLLRNFFMNISGGTKNKFRLAIPSVGEVKYIDTNNIIRLEAERNYTRFHIHKGNSFISSKTLKEYEIILKDHRFIRVHKSHLVNLSYVEKYDAGGWLLLSDNSRVEVSRRRKDYVTGKLKE
jgi:two-component system, LytTR family, response regulator